MTAAAGCLPTGAGCPLLAPQPWLDLLQAGLSPGELTEWSGSTEPKPSPLEKPQCLRGTLAPEGNKDLERPLAPVTRKEPPAAQG